MERRFHFSCSHLWQGQFRSLAARGWTVLPIHLWTGQSPWVKCTISSSSIQGYISKQHFWFSWSYCKNRLMYILTACTPWMIPLVSTATLCVLPRPVEDEIHISYFGGVNSGHFYKVNMLSKHTSSHTSCLHSLSYCKFLNLRRMKSLKNIGNISTRVKFVGRNFPQKCSS